MQPIVQHTLTVTITETWTITWPDGHESVWHDTEVVEWPVSSGPEGSLLTQAAADDDEAGVLDSADDDSSAVDG